MNIPVLYEDEWLEVLDKPSGLVTIPTPKKEMRTLTSILNDDLKQKGALYRLHPCHRLDRDTSGLIIYAKGKSVQKKMMDLFKQRLVKKTYIAFVQGALPLDKSEVNAPVEGRHAVTRYRVLQKRKNYTVVEVEPLTGRTNQIRIHFKRIGHPVLGDTRFAFRRDFLTRTKRLCLHAKRLEFLHPVTKKIINIEARLPAQMQNIKEED